MNPLVSLLAERVNAHVSEILKGMPASASSEWRSFFHGPPMEFLVPLFDALSADGGIRASLADGSQVRVPVLLVDESFKGANPAIGQSGRCNKDHVTDCRNAQGDCRFFVALVGPGVQLSQTLTTACATFGVSAANNSEQATADDWWEDDFIQSMVERVFGSLQIQGAGKMPEHQEQVRALLHRAVRCADAAEGFKASRLGCWNLFARLFAFRAGGNAAEAVSLACGVPPLGGGLLKADRQADVLDLLAAHLQDKGLAAGMAQLVDENPDLAAELSEFGLALRSKCDLPQVFSQAPLFHYSPCDGSSPCVPPPRWWTKLTVEAWEKMLDADEPEGKFEITCANQIAGWRGAGVAVTQTEVQLRCSHSSDVEGPVNALMQRKAPGVTVEQRPFSLSKGVEQLYEDSEVPYHKSPIRYSLLADGFKGKAMKVVVLDRWEPGVVVNSRNAAKVTVPQQAKRVQGIDLECSVTLSGPGRHYIDVHTGPGVVLDGTVQIEPEGDDVEQTSTTVAISSGADRLHGFEAEILDRATCLVRFTQAKRNGEGSVPRVLRITFTCEELDPEGCRSEFESLILQHRKGGQGRPPSVQVDRNVRCADLQGWMLEVENVPYSFYPLAISTDCAFAWGRPSWTDAAKAVLTKGRFLRDPRPSLSQMQPPREFLEARAAIAARIRGVDGCGLVEGASLGEWLARDGDFALKLEEYLKTYREWMDNDPMAAAWSDVIAFCCMEQDQSTLRQEPEAIILTPLHPLRLAWQALAQQALFDSLNKGHPCPAASVLDPDMVPDVVFLPLTGSDGQVTNRAYLASDCSSDYWAVLWNGQRLDSLRMMADSAPFTGDFGVRIGGLAQCFSASQVGRALDSVSSILASKPQLTVSVASTSGQTDACNVGLAEWGRARLGQVEEKDGAPYVLGPRELRILDRRPRESQPSHSDIANLAEDIGYSVRWYAPKGEEQASDLGVVAQLEASNPRQRPVETASIIGMGGLLRHRIRRQLRDGAGAFLVESRSGKAVPPSGEQLADLLARTLSQIEGMAGGAVGVEFAPSVSAIESVLRKSTFAAVSSSAIDPACFLGGWLPGSYLWDYELPSYGQRSGDTTGYYLLSQYKEQDREVVRTTLKILKLEDLADASIEDIIREVSHRGIPTVKGLSSGDNGAAGNLGLLVACRLLQDAFRGEVKQAGLLPVIDHDGCGGVRIAMIVPVDPFNGYIGDLQAALKVREHLRPDLVVVGIHLSKSSCHMRVTPIEVKFRTPIMSSPDRISALGQAKSLGSLLSNLRKVGDSGLVLWKLANQHFIKSLVDYGFRVYSQQLASGGKSTDWAQYHARATEAILSGCAHVDVDGRGRLVVLDGSMSSVTADMDADKFPETIVIARQDATSMLASQDAAIVAAIKGKVGDWDLFPKVPGEEPPAQLAVPPVEPAVAVVAPPVPVVPPPVVVPPVPPVEPPALVIAPVVSVPVPVSPSPALSVSAEYPHGVQICIGEVANSFQSAKRFFEPSDTKLNQMNIGVVGDLGKGKTQFLQGLLHGFSGCAAANRGIRPRVLIFDYKKDYSKEEFVKAVGARVVKPHKLPLNLFDLNSSQDALVPWLDRFGFFVDVLSKIYSGIGPVQRKNLKEVVRTAYDVAASAGTMPTVYDVRDLYDERVEGVADSPLSILEDMVDLQLFERDLSKVVPFSQFLDGVVVIDLGSLGQNDAAKNMLVAIMLNMFYEHMLKIEKRPFLGKDPQLRVLDSFLLVDEADNIMRYEFEVLRKLLLQGREFGVGIILASQYLSHFKAGATNYREMLLTWFIHQVPNVTPLELQQLGLTSEAAEMASLVKTLPNHHCLYKSTGGTAEILNGLPFYKIMQESTTG